MATRRRQRRVPLRRCVVCREQAPKEGLVRLMWLEGTGLARDDGGKGPGRGAYLCGRPACWTDRSMPSRVRAALKAELTQEDSRRLAEMSAAAVAGHRAAVAPKTE